MKPVSHCVVTAVLAVAFAVASVGACSAERSAFELQDRGIVPDAAVAPDAPDCRLQCSLDGRSVIEACSGTVVEACGANLACGAGRCQEPCAAAAADRSSNGCDFYLQMPRVDKYWPHSCNAAFIVNTSTQPASVKLSREGKEIDISKSLFRTNLGSSDLIAHEGPIAPGESAILFVSDSPPGADGTARYIACPKGVTPATTDDKVPHKTGIGSSFRLTADVPVALTSMYPFGGAKSYLPSATLVLPVATWEKEHMIVNGWSVSEAGWPFVQIVAAEDATEVTIVPKKNIIGGSGVPGALPHARATYRLERGQHLQIVQGEELTGSIVTSNKSITIFGGNSCAYIPSEAQACDILSQQIPAYQQWGSEYVGVAYRPRTKNEHEPVPYRIVAARDGTRLDYDPEIPPGAPTTMNAGEVVTFHRGTGDAFVVRTQDAEHPIYVSAHMTGCAGGNGAPGYGNWGDPEFVNVVPTGQYTSSYSFYADSTYSENSLVVVRKKIGGAFKDVWLECAGNLTTWKPVGTRGEYEFTRVDLSRNFGPGDTFGANICRSGLQRMRSDGPFTATVWGWDYAASYAYTSGTAQRKLVDVALDPIK